MEFRTLQGTGAVVSRCSLGTMTFGDQVDETTALRTLDTALAAGVNFVDTADVYVGGRSEEIIGRALRRRRHRVVLASKVGNRAGEDPYRDLGLHRWHVTRAVEASLRRLQTDCLDLCYMHRPDPGTPIEETLAACDQLVRQGKVLYVGMSNYASWQVCEALWQADVQHWSAPVVMQLPYNLITRSIDAECVAFAQRMGIGLTVYNPLAGGLLTGKHDRQAGPVRDTRLARSEMYYGRFWSDVNLEAVEALRKVAAEAGKTMVELALQWLLAQPHVDSVILGVSALDQLEQDLAASQGCLAAETLAACDRIWQRVRGPHFQYNR
jgi:1-deoxyxylulose-5-phosphate synthase